jgi:hypothetical protein
VSPSTRKNKGGGKPYQSKLEPFFELVETERRKRKTWPQIAEMITAQGVSCTPQGVYSFLKSRKKRRYPFGMEPTSEQSQPAKAATPAGAAQPAAAQHARKEEPKDPFSVETEEEIFGINKPKES